MAPRKWVEKLDAAIAELDRLVPADATTIIVDEDQLAGSAVHRGRKVVPFTELNGHYNGPPTDDDAAIQELDRLRQAGARFIAFAWPASWWLDHYQGLKRYLEAEFTCLLSDDSWTLFQLD